MRVFEGNKKNLNKRISQTLVWKPSQRCSRKLIIEDFEIVYKHCFIFQVFLFSLFITITLRDKYQYSKECITIEIGTKFLVGGWSC